MSVVVEAFHATTQLSRNAVFDDSRLDPTTALPHASLAPPGWVGADWRPGGTIFVAINPGGGRDTYRVNPTDKQLYGAVRAFKDADQTARGAALAKLSKLWIDIQQTHNIRRVINPVLDATGSSAQAAAFLNVLPFRTRNDKPARVAELRRAWDLATSRQVTALAPRRIVALGCKAHDALISVGADRSCEIVLLKRAIGDSRLTPHAVEAIAKLRRAG